MITGIVAGLPSIPVVPGLVAEYLNAAEYTHDWANLTGWTNTNVQVSGNKLFGVSGGNPAGAGRAFSIPAGFIGRITAEIVEVASGASFRFVGLNFGGASNGVLASLPNFAGIGMGTTSRTAAAWVGANFSGVTTGQIALGTAAAVGTFRVTVTVTEDVISMVLRRQDGAEEWSHVVARSAAPNGGNVTDLVVWNGSNAGTAGSYVKAVGIKASLTPFRTKSNAAGVIEGNTGQVVRRNIGDTWRIQSPAVGDGMNAAPVVVFMHQASSGTADSVWSEARMRPVMQALEAAGYVLVSANDGGDRWGNSASLTNYAALVDWIKARYYCGPILLLGPSMGGAPMFNAIVRGAIPGVVGAAGICPVCDLDNMYANASFTAALRTAYGATDDAGFVANSEGWSPNDNLGPAFAGVRFRFYAGAAGSDTVVPRAQHIDLLQAVIAPYVPEAEIITAGSGHLQIEQYQPIDLLAFYARCVAPVPVTPADFFVLPLTYDELDSTEAITWARSGGTAPHVTPDGFEGDGYAARLKAGILPTWLSDAASPLGLQATMKVYPGKLKTTTGETILHVGADAAGVAPNCRLALRALQGDNDATQSYLALQSYTTALQTFPLTRPTWKYEGRYPQLTSGGFAARPQGLLFLDATTLIVCAHYEDNESRVHRIDLTTNNVTGQFTFGTDNTHVGAFDRDASGNIWCGDYDTGRLLKLDLAASFASGTAVVTATVGANAVTGMAALAFATVSGTEYVLLAEYVTSGTAYLYAYPSSLLVDGTSLTTATRYKRFQIGQRVQGITLDSAGNIWLARNRRAGDSVHYGWLERIGTATAVLALADGVGLTVEFNTPAPSEYPEDITFHPTTGRLWTMTEGWSAVGDYSGWLGIWSTAADGSAEEHTVLANYDGTGSVAISLNGHAFDSVAWSITQAAATVSVGGPPQAAAGIQAGYFSGFVKNVRLQGGAITASQYAETVSGSYEPNSLTTYTLTLTNPGAETGDISGWTNEVGGLAVRNALPPPSSGAWYFSGGANAQTIARQRVDLLTQTGLSGAEVDAGGLWVKERWLQSAYTVQDPCGMGVRKLDASQVQQALDYNGIVATPHGGGASGPWYWYERSQSSSIPSGCRYLDAVYRADRDSGTNNDGYTDSIRLVVYRR